MRRIAPERIEKAFRDAWREAFVHDLKASFWPSALLICGLALIMGGYIATRPLSQIGTIEGRIVGGRQQPAEDIPPGMDVRVALDGGGQVSVSLPRGTIYRTDVKVELGVYERQWPSGSRAFRFRRYLEPTTAIHPETE